VSVSQAFGFGAAVGALLSGHALVAGHARIMSSSSCRAAWAHVPRAPLYVLYTTLELYVSMCVRCGR
jgi:hypothetical protein